MLIYIVSGSERRNILCFLCFIHRHFLKHFLLINSITINIFLGSLQKICKPGWVTFNPANGGTDYCYRLFDTPKTWNDAKTACNNNNQAELLSIHEK